jgi:hypothetical protein
VIAIRGETLTPRRPSDLDEQKGWRREFSGHLRVRMDTGVSGGREKEGGGRGFGGS